MLSFLLLLSTFGMYADKDNNESNAPRKIFAEIIPDTDQPPKEKLVEIFKRMNVWFGEKKEEVSDFLSPSVNEDQTKRKKEISEDEIQAPSNDALSDEAAGSENVGAQDGTSVKALNATTLDVITEVVESDASGDPIEPEDPESSNSVVRMFKNYTRVQLASLIGIVTILGYAGYQAYLWWQERAMPLDPLRITEREHEVICSLMDSMKQDVEHLSAGNRQPSMVKQFDLSEVNAELAAELNMLQSLFVDLYNSCEENKENIHMLDCIYKNIQQGVDMRLTHAEIITLEDERVAEQELVA
ncbi:MAG: hypothetical protein WD055_05620 [Candidatus Dependentiae bacterium]